MTEEEKTNCQDYKRVAEIVNWWNKPDDEINLPFDYKYGYTYYWISGVLRSRMVKRPSWDKIKKFKV